MQEAAEQPNLPDVRINGRLADLPAEALSTALSSIGVQMSPEEILQERLAMKGYAPPPQIQQPQGVQQLGQDPQQMQLLQNMQQL